MRKKMKVLIGLLALALPLGACQTTAQMDPQTQAAVTSAFNAVCPGVTGGGLDVLISQQNSNVQSAYSSAKQICSAGAPTNLVVAGMDIMVIQSVLSPYLGKRR